MKIIRVYDGGARGGHKCVCGRTIRYVAEVEDGGARFNLGSECIKNLSSPKLRVQIQDKIANLRKMARTSGQEGEPNAPLPF